MRTLKFIVKGQILEPDPFCSFTDLVPGTEKHLLAKFTFGNSEWHDCVKVASFYSALGREYTPQRIVDGYCYIPAEALQKRTFKMQVVGQSTNGEKIRTNKIKICQDGGKK